MRLSDCKIGDKVKIPIASCGCCLSSSPDIDWASTAKTTTVVVLDIDSRGSRLLASEEENKFCSELIGLAYLPYKYGRWRATNYQCELVEVAKPEEKVEPVVENPKATVMKTLSELAPGTRVRISIAEMNRSGATVAVPLEGIVIKDALRPGSPYPCVAWKAAEHAAKGIDVNEETSDVNFPELTKGCHFYQDTQVEVLTDVPSPPVEERKTQPKRLLEDYKPGDKVRIIPADVRAVVGNNGLLAYSEDPLEATVITYEGKDRFSGCMVLAWDPELHPNEKRNTTTFREAAFPKLTRGLFIMANTPCELIAAASETVPSSEIPQAQVGSNIEQQTETLLDSITKFNQQMDKILADTKRQVGTLEELFPVSDTSEMSEADEKLAQDMVKVFDKIGDRFEQIEAKEREGKLDSKSAIEEMSKLLQALEGSLDKLEPERIGEPTFFGNHAALVDLHLPKAKTKSAKSDKTGFLLACAAAGVGLSGLAASTLPAIVKTPKKPRKRTSKKDKNVAQG